MIYTLSFYKQKTKNKKKKEEKQAKRNLMSTLDIRDVLDGITERLGNPIDENLFLYLEFDMNKYLKS